MPDITAQHIEQRIKEIKELLHNGENPTVKDVCWVMLSVAEDMKRLAEVHWQCPARQAWQESKPWRDRVINSLLSAVLLGLGWAIISAIRAGFKLP